MGAPLVDYCLLPWTSLGKVSTIKPNAVELRAEVLCHVALHNTILMALSFDTVSHMQPATAEKCEEKWQTLILQVPCYE